MSLRTAGLSSDMGNRQASSMRNRFNVGSNVFLYPFDIVPTAKAVSPKLYTPNPEDLKGSRVVGFPPLQYP